MSKEKESKKFLQDMATWQNKQYLPGAYTGSDIPFPIKQLGKKKWFRTYTIFYLLLLTIALTFAFVGMVVYIAKQ